MNNELISIVSSTDEIANSLFAPILSLIPFVFIILLLWTVFKLLFSLFFWSFISIFDYSVTYSKTELDVVNDELDSIQKKKNEILNKRRQIKRSIQKQVNSKLDDLQLSVNNRFTEFSDYFYLLRKSINLKSEATNLSLLLKNKKYININSLINLKK